MPSCGDEEHVSRSIVEVGMWIPRRSRERYKEYLSLRIHPHVVSRGQLDSERSFFSGCTYRFSILIGV